MDISMVLKEALVDLSSLPWAAAGSPLNTMLYPTWFGQVPGGAFLLPSLQRQDGWLPVGHALPTSFSLLHPHTFLPQSLPPTLPGWATVIRRHSWTG